jgi:copper(I)-binding protein
MMRSRSVHGSVAVVLGVLSSLITLSACGSQGEISTRLAAYSAWSRPTPAGADAGVVYLTVSTDVADALVGARVDDTVADSVEMHATTVESGGGAHSHGGGSAEVFSMGSVDQFELEDGESLVFEPGGNHLMLIDLAEPLELGDTYELVLEFSSGRQLVVDVTVADNPPA